MTNEEAAIERARIIENDREKEAKERNTNSKDRSSEVDAKNAERKQQREEATTALQSGNVNLQEIARQGGSLGRRVEREVRRFEATGKVSNWLTGETLKAEAAQNAAQQSAFRQDVIDVVSTMQAPLPLGPITPFFLPDLHRKPEILDEGGGGGGSGETICNGLSLYIKVDGEDFEVWIRAGIVEGEVPTGLDPLNGKRISNNGSGYVFLEVEINSITGAIESTSIEDGNSIPQNTDTKFYYAIGYYEYLEENNPVISNYGCGPIEFTTCRNWYVADPPYFTANFSR
jgi:hypothetical protein